MTRKYWLDLFTGTTWEEFLEHGAEISGFRASRKSLAERISPGDYLLCYLTGISRFIGILEVKSKCYEDATPIWRDEQFPIRFDVELVEKLDARTAVPVLSLKDELEIFRGSSPGMPGPVSSVALPPSSARRMVRPSSAP